MCGIFGVFGHPEASNLTYLGLHSLQHRGQESAGIVSSLQGELHGYRAMGHVADAFPADVLERLPGNQAIGHVRYSTAGDSLLKNAQPFWINYQLGGLAIAHNGNLVNAGELQAELERDGSIFQSNMDTEVIVHLIARSSEADVETRLLNALERVEGAYSIVLLTAEGMIAARDPHGLRPLVLGRFGDSTIVASETCALGLIGATYIREVEPGEMVIINDEETRSRRIGKGPTEVKRCAFEYVYFSRPDSKIFGQDVYGVRRAMGRRLAAEQPAEVDVVMPVPDSGVAAALGFAEALKQPYELGLLRSHYVGRTFIEPQDSIRHFGVKLKLAPIREVIEGRRVAVVDDSIVRGTTSRKIIAMIRQAGAREVHFRVSSPPTRWPCYYGIDTPTREELIAAQKSVEEIREYLGANSLGYLSLQGLLDIVTEDAGGKGFCHACWSGSYPIPTPSPLKSSPRSAPP